MFDAIEPDWIVWAAGGTFALGYLIINQVILRWMVNLGTLLYIWFYAVSISDPTAMYAAIWTSVIMGAANCIGLAQIYYNNSKLVVPQKHRDIYPLFSTLPPGDFRALMNLAERTVTEKSEKITIEGTENGTLYYVLSGDLRAEKKGQKFLLPSNIFVGEVAYMTHQKASATTVVSKGAEILKWDIPTLRQKSAKNDRFRLALEAMISNDLAQKVTVAVAPKDFKPRTIAAE